MLRTRRILLPDYPHHIVSRGNNQRRVFLNDEDKSYYRYLAHKYKNENNIEIYHYCLMDNHVHWNLRLMEKSRLDRFIKQVQLAFYQIWKARSGLVGHLWQGRFAENEWDPLITPNPWYERLAKTPEERRRIYRAIVVDESRMGMSSFKEGPFFGSREFVKKMEERYGIGPDDGKEK